MKPRIDAPFPDAGVPAALQCLGDFGSLRMFRLVVELRSFSAAAKRLGVGPGTVSKHITSLEKGLGARLIQRTTRQLQITEAGEMLYAPCVRILDEIDAVHEGFVQLKGQPAGALRVSVPTVLGLRYLSPALPEFLRAFPKISVDLVLTTTKVDLVAEGIDVSIRFGEQTEPNLVSVPLARSSNVFAAAPEYFARCGTPRVPADLQRHNCLIVRHLSPGGLWPVGRHTSQLLKVSGNLLADNGEVTRQAAIAGLGIAMLPSFLIEQDLRERRLVAVLDAYAQENGIFAVMPGRQHIPAKVRAFLDFLKRVLGRPATPLD